MPVNKDFYTLAGSSGQSTGFTIKNSLRFNDDDSGFILDGGTDAGDTRKKNTWSLWVKRGNLGSLMYIGAYRYDATNYQYLSFDSSNRLEFTDVTGGSVQAKLITNRVFRDPAAWYHIVAAWDTAAVSSASRIILYVNGIRETNFNTQTLPSENADSGGAGRADARLRFGTYDATGNYLDGYLAEVHYTDNYAYDPSSFGELKEDTDIWIPKEADVSYGSAGAYLDFETSGTLGANAKGKGNFSLSGVTTHDQMTDTPTNNFAVINSVYADDAAAGNAGTLSNGNLQYVGGGSTFSVKGLTYNLPKSGKWYFEYMIGGSLDGFGYVIEGQQTTINASNGPGHLSVSQGGGIQYHGWRNGGNATVNFMDSNTGSPFSAGFIHQVAIDVDGGKFYYGVKNTYYAADTGTDGNPSAGTNHIATFAFSTNDIVLLAGNYSGTQYWNFGQDGTFAGQQTAQGNSDANGIGNFFYAVPTGYLALCSSNLGAV